jgi:hypothetical protein
LCFNSLHDLGQEAINAYNEVEIFVGCAPEGETLGWFFIGK